MHVKYGKNHAKNHKVMIVSALTILTRILSILYLRKYHTCCIESFMRSGEFWVSFQFTIDQLECCFQIQAECRVLSIQFSREARFHDPVQGQGKAHLTTYGEHAGDSQFVVFFYQDFVGKAFEFADESEEFRFVVVDGF